MCARFSVVAAAIVVFTSIAGCGSTAEFANGTVGPGPAACAQTVQPLSQNAPASGGSFVIEITTPAECGWNAVSDEGWIAVTRGSGSGSGSVAYSVAQNPTPSAREGRVRVGDLAVSVTQAGGVVNTPAPQPGPAPGPEPPAPPSPPAPEDCRISLSPPSVSVTDAGASQEIVVVTGQRCEWHAAVEAVWIGLGSASGTGPGRVLLDIAANPSSTPRSTQVRVGDDSVSVTQGGRAVASCDGLRLEPESQASGVAGGSFRATVSAPAECKWTAASDGWISVSPTSGSGTVSIDYTVAANSTTSRRGAIQVGNRSLTINQDGCSFTVSPSAQSVPQSGGRFTATVTTSTACMWTASSSVPWIELAGGSGRGTGQVSFTVGANAGDARSGRVTVGGQSVEVRQTGPSSCPESVTPASASVRASGEDVGFSVTAAADCKWTASSDASWIAIVSGSGAGSGRGSVTVRPNDGGSRSARVRIGAQSIEIRQAAAPCPASVTPTTTSLGAGAGEFTFSVTAAADCKWSASSSVSWMTASGSGAGSGRGVITVRANDGATRSGRIQIGERTIDVSQSAADPATCTYSVSPESQTFGPEGGKLVVTITTGARCTWGAKTGADWITPPAANGTGSSTVTFAVSAIATRTARDASIFFPGRTVTIRQTVR